MENGIKTDQKLFPFYLVKCGGAVHKHYVSADLTASQKVNLFQELIDGTYDTVISERAVALVDDEGLLKEKSINLPMSMYLNVAINGDVIVFAKEVFEAFDKSMEEED